MNLLTRTIQLTTIDKLQPITYCKQQDPFLQRIIGHFRRIAH